uniref:Uncharacterized protein n=1 Tax=Anguilla anguilla TaxID=7936 RepID=A0A0E9PXB9_ANGAN
MSLGSEQHVLRDCLPPSFP